MNEMVKWGLLGGAVTAGITWMLVGLNAAPVSTSTQDLLQLLDVDRNGAVSKAEYDRVSDGELAFTTVDLDHSGQLEPDEMEALVVHISPLSDLGNRLPRVR